MAGLEATRGPGADPMRRRISRWLKRGAILLGVALLAVLAVRAYDAQRGDPLELWHTHAPRELHVKELQAADWSRYLAAENAAFDEVRAEVTDKLEPEAQTPGQPLLRGQSDPSRALRARLESLVHPRAPGRPGGRRRVPARAHRLALQRPPPRAPLSRRGLRRHRDPAAGPRHRAGRADGVEWDDWSAATRLAVREARRAHRADAAAAPRRLFERRRAGDEVRARRARGSDAAARRAASC